MLKNHIKNHIAALLVPVCLLFCGCSTNPVTGEEQFMIVSSAQEEQIGRQYAPEIEKQMGGRIDSERLQNYVSTVGNKIARISHTPNAPFSYVAVNHESINAMALPGGYIFITRGMLEKLTSEAQLASVLAHETVHVTARHSAKAMSEQIGMDILLSAVIGQSTPQSTATVARLGSQLLGLKKSRSSEIEADTFGQGYLIRAGYDPQAMIEMMEMLESENEERPIEFFSTHPNPENRQANLQKILEDQIFLSKLNVGKSEYQENVLAILPTIPKPEKK